MGKFFNEESARCAACGTLLTSMGLARNQNHLYKLGTMYGCECEKTKVWTNSIRNEKALLAYWSGATDRYMQGFCNDLFDGEGREIVPLRSVNFPGEEQRGQVYVPLEQVNAPESLSLVVWSGRFWPEFEGKARLIEQYRVYADEIARLVAEPRRNPTLKLAALRDMVHEHAHQSAQEEARWGKPLSRPAPKTYAQLAEHGLSRADVNALEREGLLQRDITTYSHDQRTGLFGKGHRKTQTQYAAVFRLTEKAFEVVSRSFDEDRPASAQKNALGWRARSR